jgi:hypothetical protein
MKKTTSNVEIRVSDIDYLIKLLVSRSIQGGYHTDPHFILPLCFIHYIFQPYTYAEEMAESQYSPQKQTLLSSSYLVISQTKTIWTRTVAEYEEQRPNIHATAHQPYTSARYSTARQ